MITLARNLTLPLSVIADTFAFLGKRGGGKTYNAQRLAEQMLDASAQIVALDPVSKWFSLRLKRDGKTPAYEIPIFGGPHGDLPITEHAGRTLADFIVDSARSVVIDLSDLETDAAFRRFATDFLRQLYRRKRQQVDPTPLHVFLEEAELIAPQDFSGADAEMIGAIKKIWKLGRNYGIGGSAITQRSADINKKVLSQTEHLLVFRTKAPQDKKAVSGWIDHAGVADSKQIVRELPTLKVGQAYYFGADNTVKCQILKKTTFDASKTPELKKRGKTIQLGKLSKAEIDALSTSMEETVEQAQQRDPKVLRRALGEARKEITVLRKEVEQLRERPSEPITVEVPSLSSDQQTALRNACSTIVSAADGIEMVLADMRGGQTPSNGRSSLTSSTRLTPKPVTQPVSAGSNTANSSSSKSFAKLADVRGPNRILAALRVFHPRPLSKTQLSMLTGYSLKASTLGVHLSKFAKTALIERSGADYTLTSHGHDQAPVVDQPTTSSELRAFWLTQLGRGESAVFELLYDRRDTGLSKAELHDQTGYSPNASTLGVVLSKLNKHKLIVRRHGRYFLTDELFPEESL